MTPDWSKTPPKDPGFWWCRVISSGHLFIVRAVDRGGALWDAADDDDDDPITSWSGHGWHEWWPIAIQPPPAPARAEEGK